MALIAGAATACSPSHHRNTDSHLLALDVHSGRVAYSVALPFPVLSGLAVGERNGREVWISGSGERGSSGQNGDVCDGRDAAVRAVEARRGRLESVSPGSPAFGNPRSPLVGESADATGIRVIQIDGHDLTKPAAFAATALSGGQTLWRHDMGIGQYSGIAADAQAAYVLQVHGPMSALDLHTGTTLWRSRAYTSTFARLERHFMDWAEVVGVTAGTVVVMDGYAVAGIDARTGAVRWSWFHGYLPTLVQTLGNTVYIAQYGAFCQWDD